MQHNVANVDEISYWTRIVKHTFFNTSGKAQRGIHDAFAGHRSVAFVFTLLTFYEIHYNQQQVHETAECNHAPDLLGPNS